MNRAEDNTFADSQKQNRPNVKPGGQFDPKKFKMSEKEKVRRVAARPFCRLSAALARTHRRWVRGLHHSSARSQTSPHTNKSR